MSFEIRAITPEELPTMARVDAIGFGETFRPELLERRREITELDRTRCAFEDGQLVGASGAYSLDLAVPGATLATGGTTAIAVLPTHRRRGMLRAMMREHLRDVSDHEEPLAALWAAEAGIYERFGYGPAVDTWHVEIDKAHAAFAHPLEPRGRCRYVDADEAAKLLPQLYEELWRERPGHFARSAAWWEHRHLWDPEWIREGMTGYHYVVYEVDGRTDGYVQYRVKQKWSDGSIPVGTVDVEDVQGRDAEARAALWRHLLDLDLMSRLEVWSQPADSELPWLLANRRHVTRSMRDAVWVRLHDPARALAGRRYAAEDRVVLRIHDAFWPDAAATYELEGGRDGAQCVRTTRTPDLEIDTADLGAVYMGGPRPSELARSGRVRGDPDVIRRLDAMFAWDRAPWCPEIF